MLLLLSCFSCVRLLATAWTAAYQAPPPMGFSRQEYWSGVPLPSCPSPNPGVLNIIMLLTKSIQVVCVCVFFIHECEVKFPIM